MLATLHVLKPRTYTSIYKGSIPSQLFLSSSIALDSFAVALPALLDSISIRLTLTRRPSAAPRRPSYLS